MTVKFTVSLQRNFLHTKLLFLRDDLLSKKTKSKFALGEVWSKLEPASIYSNKSIKPKVTADEFFPTPIPVEKPEKISKQIKKTRRFNWRMVLFTFFTSCSLAIMLLLFAPAIYLKFFPSDPVPIKTTESGTPIGGRFDQGTQQTAQQFVTPPLDPTLPDGTWVIIPRIGVDTQIYDSQNSEDALSKGVWRVPDFGQPGELDKPIILAAHRIGYIWWWKGNGQYAKLHSFYNLPQLQPGDLVEVIANKREYTYEVYSGEKGTAISDYNADMILYTCEFLNGPTRFFRYARLINPNENTQQQHAQNTGSTAKLGS